MNLKKSHHTCKWVVSHIWTSHITHVNESCLTYALHIPHIWIVLHWKFLGIQRVSNPSTENQRISTPAHSFVVRIGKYVSPVMVQIKQKVVYGVGNPPKRIFWAACFTHERLAGSWKYSGCFAPWLAKEPEKKSNKVNYSGSFVLAKEVLNWQKSPTTAEPFFKRDLAIKGEIAIGNHWATPHLERKSF